MNGNNDEVSKKINKHKSPELEDLSKFVTDAVYLVYKKKQILLCNYIL